MLIRVLVAVLVMMGCGFDLVLENLRQRELRYQIQIVDRELGHAELRLEARRLALQSVVVDACFGQDSELKLLPRANASTTPNGSTDVLLAAASERRRR